MRKKNAFNGCIIWRKLSLITVNAPKVIKAGVKENSKRAIKENHYIVENSMIHDSKRLYTDG